MPLWAHIFCFQAACFQAAFFIGALVVRSTRLYKCSFDNCVHYIAIKVLFSVRFSKFIRSQLPLLLQKLGDLGGFVPYFSADGVVADQFLLTIPSQRALGDAQQQAHVLVVDQFVAIQREHLPLLGEQLFFDACEVLHDFAEHLLNLKFVDVHNPAGLLVQDYGMRHEGLSRPEYKAGSFCRYQSDSQPHSFHCLAVQEKQAVEERRFVLLAGQ